MKFTIALLGTTMAQTPMFNKVPGWNIGTPGADISVLAIYDPICPDSADMHNVTKTFLYRQSPIEGKFYKDLIDWRIVNFALPYHEHCWQVNKVIPYLEDKCAQNATQCFMTQYIEHAFSLND